MKNYRMLRLVVLLGTVGVSFSTLAATRTWKGGTKTGSVYLASTDANWFEATAPAEGDDVLFDSTATSDCQWDLDVKVGNWTQDAGFVKTVTIATVYDPTGFDCLEISGSVDLQGGTWTHLTNHDKTNLRRYRLYAKVGGSFTLGSGAKITATGLGYSYPFAGDGVLALTSGNMGGNHAAYGGYRSGTTWPDAIKPYGNACAPEEPGGGGSGNAGGGAVRLDVAGAFSLGGTVDANAASGQYYRGAGGSVYIRAASISGAGTLEAKTKSDASYSDGSGGRIAVILTGTGTDFSGFDPWTQCNVDSVYTAFGSGNYAENGTVYLEKKADAGSGWLIVKGTGRKNGSNAQCNSISALGKDGGTVAFSRITLTNAVSLLVLPGTTNDISVAAIANTNADATVNGITVGGGKLKLAANATVTIPVATSAGLGVFDCSTLTVPADVTVTVETNDGEDFDGDVTVAEGGTIAANARMGVTGDLTVSGSVRRTVRSNTNAALPDPTEISVGGDMTVSASGVVSVDGMGYARNSGPKDQVWSPSSGGAHGGYGWQNGSTKSSNVVPFGSVREPVTGGGGGSNDGNGGGILKLTVAGDLDNDGTISANGDPANYYSSAGGSVNIRAKTLSGSGNILARAGTSVNGGSGNYGIGGGGRVAIRLTGASATFDGFTGTIGAWASRRTSYSAKSSATAGAGTIWLKTAARDESAGTLIVENEFENMTYVNNTPLGTDYMADDLAYGDVLIGRSAKLQLCSGKQLFVSGVFSNGCTFAAEASSTVTFNGSGTSRIYGDTTFVNLTCTTPGKTVSVAGGATVTVSDVADFANCTLTGDAAWNLVANGSVAMTGVSLGNCQPSKAITVVNGTDLGGNGANVTFVTIQPGETVTWTGDAGTSWSDAGNWDRSRAPIATDRIVIPAGAANDPVLATDVEVLELSVADGASLNVAERHLTVSNATITGSLVATGAAVLEAKGELSILGEVTPSSSTILLSGTVAQAFTANGNTFNAIEVESAAVAFSGDFTASALTIGDGATAFDCTFAAGETLTVGSFVARGVPTSRLRGAEDADVWKLIVNEAAVTNVSVRGSDASEGVAIVPTLCTDAGNNENWLFVDNRTHWNGTAWSDGEPTAAKDAVVDEGATLAISSAFAAKGFTVSKGATVTITAQAAFAGSFVIESDATVTWSVPGTIAGNLVLLKGATLTHAANSTTELYKLDLTVGGNGSVASGAAITARGKGYAGSYVGPGSVKNSSRGSSYGGRGYANGGTTTTPCYGSILCPTNIGSCGSNANFPAGGAIKVVCGGSLRIDGEVNAEPTAGCDYYSSSGGSIWLGAKRMLGSGKIGANGGLCSNHSHGGGGRIAIYLTEADSLDDFTGSVTAYGGRYSDESSTKGSPGTIYVQGASDAPGAGTVTVANCYGYVDYTEAHNATDIPVVGNPKELERATFVLKNYATLYLTTNAVIGDVRFEMTSDEMSGSSYSRIKLNGYRLKIRSYEHALSPDDSKYVIPDGGAVIFRKKGLQLFVR